MSYPTMEKDKDALLDYFWDWSGWLTGTETITAVTWIVPTGIVNDHTAATTTTATIWLSGGALSTSYVVTCRVTTSEGRVDDRSVKIRVTDR